jgi:Tfp pilus assembly protein PilN
MIKINLLPGKPKRKAAFKYDLYVCIAVTVINGLILGGLYYNNIREIDNYQNMIVKVKQEKASLEPIYAEYLNLEKGKKDLERRISAIGGLKEGRALAARTLYDLTAVARESLWLKSFRKTQNRFELEGRSLENESISSFIESLSRIPYMTNVELKNVEDVTDEGITVKKFLIHGNIGL